MHSVLIVEDHPDLAQVMTRLLKSNGVNATAMAGGRSALEWINRNRPQLVLLDVMMPGMSGLDVLRELRANPEFSDTVVVMYTAIDDTQTESEALALGAAEYIVKGTLSGQGLADLVQRHVGKTALQPPAAGIGQLPAAR